MGTSYKVVIKSDREIDADFISSQIDSLLKVVNQSMSTYIDNSEISIFNKAKKDSPIKISDHFDHVLKKSFYHWCFDKSGTYCINTNIAFCEINSHSFG
mgnify:CR=1 FL=1